MMAIKLHLFLVLNAKILACMKGMKKKSKFGFPFLYIDAPFK